MGFEIVYDPGQNINIVKTVKKYPVIYNVKKYPVVESRALAEKAWTKIAAEVGVSESYCKSRWTNIKGCFKRYLRNKAQSSSTKTYYLADYLEFMLPFMNLPKSLFKQYNKGNKFSPSISSDSTFDVPMEKGEELDRSKELEVNLVDSDGEEESFFISTGSESAEEEGDQSADWDFFSSLLPDVKKMNAQQKSKFRNALLSAIDTALYGEDF